MKRRRKSFDPSLKARIALEAYKGEKSLAELGSQYEVHPTQIREWKKRLLEGVTSLFGRGGDRSQKAQADQIDELYRHIGQLKVELDWVKKKSAGFD